MDALVDKKKLHPVWSLFFLVSWLIVLGAFGGEILFQKCKGKNFGKNLEIPSRYKIVFITLQIGNQNLPKCVTQMVSQIPIQKLHRKQAANIPVNKKKRKPWIWKTKGIYIDSSKWDQLRGTQFGSFQSILITNDEGRNFRE